MSTTENSRNAKFKWSAYGWQCDMIGIPAVRHSDTGQESPLGTFIYRFCRESDLYSCMHCRDQLIGSDHKTKVGQSDLVYWVFWSCAVSWVSLPMGYLFISYVAWQFIVIISLSFVFTSFTYRGEPGPGYVKPGRAYNPGLLSGLLRQPKPTLVRTECDCPVKTKWLSFCSRNFVLFPGQKSKSRIQSLLNIYETRMQSCRDCILSTWIVLSTWDIKPSSSCPESVVMCMKVHYQQRLVSTTLTLTIFSHLVLL